MSVRSNIIIQKQAGKAVEYTQIYCPSGGLPEFIGENIIKDLLKFKESKNRTEIFATTKSLANALMKESRVHLYQVELTTTNIDEINLDITSEFLYIIDMDEKTLYIKEFISKDLHNYIVQHEQGHVPANPRFHDDWDDWKTKPFSSIFYEAYELDRINY